MATSSFFFPLHNMAKMSLFINFLKKICTCNKGSFFCLQGCEISPPKKSPIPTKDQFIFKRPKTCTMGNLKSLDQLLIIPQIVTFQWKKDIKTLNPKP